MKNLVLFLLVLTTFTNLKAQEKKYMIWGSYVIAPSSVSYQMIYRVDSFFERYEDGTAQGYGIGFSVPVSKLFSPIVNIDFISRNGIDTHGTLNNRVKISGTRFQFGGAFHLKRKSSPYIDLNVGFIRNKFKTIEDYYNIESFEKTGTGRGMYLGPSLLIGITNYSAIRFGNNFIFNGINFEDNPNYDGSGEISQFVALSLEFSISYVFRF